MVGFFFGFFLAALKMSQFEILQVANFRMILRNVLKVITKEV